MFRNYSIIITIFGILSLNGQNKTDSKDFYIWFDKQVGVENTGLNNGIRYKELFRVKNGKHKFYKSSLFIKGDISYDGQPYFNIDLKYDLYEDQIIINLLTKNGNSLFQLIKNHIDGFNIDQKKFVNLYSYKTENSTISINGFYEILYNSDYLTLYKKHKKNRTKHFENKIIFSEFKNKNEYYFFIDKGYYLVKSKNDIIKIFPNLRKEINKYYNDNRILLKSNFDLFLIQLSQRITDLNLKIKNR